MRKKGVLLALLCALAGGAVPAPLSITPGPQLSFGRFVAGTGGSVTVGPTGARASAGGVVLVPPGGSAATFTVQGDAALTYSIGLPADGVVSLSGPGGSMGVNLFVSVPAAAGVLGGIGAQTLTVGATLSVGNNQAPGPYSGNFTVTVNYN